MRGEGISRQWSVVSGQSKNAQTGARGLARHFSFAALVLICGVATARAQVLTGTPPFGSFGGGPDIVNLANNNVRRNFGVLNKPGRGLPFSYTVTYDR